MENLNIREIVDFKDYVVKTYKKEGNPDLHQREKLYFILSKTYYDKSLKKYVESGSIFIDAKFAKALVEVLGIRLFDNAKIFEK